MTGKSDATNAVSRIAYITSCARDNTTIGGYKDIQAVYISHIADCSYTMYIYTIIQLYWSYTTTGGAVEEAKQLRRMPDHSTIRAEHDFREGEMAWNCQHVHAPMIMAL